MSRFAAALIVACAPVLGADEPKPLTDDFEGTKAGAVPKGWTVAKTGPGAGSAWKVIEDQTAPKGPKVLAQTAESEKAVFNLCVLADAKFKDVELTVAFKAVAGATDQGGGVVWRYKDANNYYVARFNPLEDNYRVYKVADGKRVQLGSAEKLVAGAGKWHTLRVTMTGDTITCALNGKTHLEVKDATFAGAGAVGLWTKADARTSFDDFRAAERK
jgi:hypothetical protein